VCKNGGMLSLKLSNHCEVLGFLGERGTGNLKFGLEVSKVWSRIVPNGNHETLVVVFMINYFLILASDCYV